MTTYTVRVPNAEHLTGSPAWDDAVLARIVERADPVLVTKFPDVASRRIGMGRIATAQIDGDHLRLDVDIDPEWRPMAEPVGGHNYPDAGLGYTRDVGDIRVRQVWLAPGLPLVMET